MSDKKKYLTQWPVRFNGERLKAEVEVEMTEKEASPLIQCGAVCFVESDLGSNNSTDELSQDQKLSAVIAAIGTMDLNLKENTIGNGSPDAGKLTELVGFNVSASLRNDAWVEFNTAQALADAIKVDGEQA